MDEKRKNDERRFSNQKVLALLLIGIGLLVAVANPIIASLTYTSRSQSIEQLMSDFAGSVGDAGATLGQTAGEVGSTIGETAGQLGETMGEVAGNFGREVGNLFAGTAPTLAEQMFAWLPLLLVAAGVVLIFRKPGRKQKNDDPSSLE